MDSRNKPVNMIIVLCDPRRVQRIAFTCRCSMRWIEFIPQELHDSDMTAQFSCPRCNTQYRLHQHQITRVKEDASGHQEEFARITTKDSRNYDA